MSANLALSHPFIFCTVGQSFRCTPPGTSNGSTNRLRGVTLGLPAGALEDQRAEKRWATQSKDLGESKFSSGLASKFHHGPVAGDNVTVIKADGTGKVHFL